MVEKEVPYRVVNVRRGLPAGRQVHFVRLDDVRMRAEEERGACIHEWGWEFGDGLRGVR